MSAADLLLHLRAAGFVLDVADDKLMLTPASMLTDDLRLAVRANKPELVALLNGDSGSLRHGPNDAESAAFGARRDHLLRWGWPEPEAAAVAARLAQRDREADGRMSCTDCRHYSPGRCGNHRRAGLGTPDVGRDLAGLLQWCPGFKS
jgi:hypothetical protein